MAQYPCSMHGGRFEGKGAGIYSNWMEEGNVRKAFKQSVCVRCLTDLVVSLKDSLTNGSLSDGSCSICHSDISTEFCMTWMNIYPPKQPEREFVLTTCSSCAQLLRTRLQEGAVALPDRTARAAALASSTDEQWEQIPW